MEFSVVIPARNSARLIDQTLAAVTQGTRQPDELLVIDGCSTDATAAIAQRYGARVVTNARLTAATARQLGTEEARGEVVAFTDSDCITAADWLARIADHFTADPDLACLGGNVVLTRPVNKVQEFSARSFEAIKQFPNVSTYITEKRMRGTISGANCAFRKAAILKAGGFRADFGNAAEETDLFWRMLEGGARLLFDPRIVVEHLGYPTTVRKLVSRNFAYGIASCRIAKYHLKTPRLDRYLYRKAFSALTQTLNPWRRDEFAFLSFLQVSAFITGKYYGSLLTRTINL